MALMITKLIPVLLMISIGIILQRVKVFTSDVVRGIKFLLVNIAIPTILFFAFAEAKLETKYNLLFVIIFLYCCLLYGIGMLLRNRLHYHFTPGFFTGFEFGTIGIALFASLWGIENLPIVVLIGLGHEIFIWFVYVPLFDYMNSRQTNLLKTLRSFATSPIIISIVAALIINLSNTYELISTNIYGASLLSTFKIISNLAQPLILIVLGYSLQFKHIQWKDSIMLIGLRFGFVLGIGTLVYLLILKVVGTIDTIFVIAFYAFILLPPPYILPVFIENNNREVQFFSNAILLYTLLSFAGYIILMII